jgi:hypothetical protein
MMQATIVVNIADNGFLVQYQNTLGQTESKVYHNADKALKFVGDKIGEDAETDTQD